MTSESSSAPRIMIESEQVRIFRIRIIGMITGWSGPIRNITHHDTILSCSINIDIVVAYPILHYPCQLRQSGDHIPCNGRSVVLDHMRISCGFDDLRLIQATEFLDTGTDLSEYDLFSVSAFEWAVRYCRNELFSHMHPLKRQISFPG